MQDEDRFVFHYDISDELRRRRAIFRKAMRKAFHPHRAMFMGTAPQLNFAHPCGTLRFGDDPATSVLDRDCKVHGLSNLYVTDSSFMPTSNGVNPSLTIAANALRVADLIAASMRPCATPMRASLSVSAATTSAGPPSPATTTPVPAR